MTPTGDVTRFEVNTNHTIGGRAGCGERFSIHRFGPPTSASA
jgi:hypothetical protein